MSKALTISEIDHSLDVIPAHLQKYQGHQLGTEKMEAEDLLIPRLCVAQSLSPQLKKTNEAYIPGLQLGDVFNSVTGQIYSNTSVRVVPLSFSTQYITFKKGGGVEAIYTNKQEVPEGQLDFRSIDGETVPPVTTKFANFLSLLIRENHKPELIVVGFKSSGIKAARKWGSLIKATNLPTFARAYTLSVAEKQDGQNSWYVFNVLPDTFVPQDFFNQAKEYFEQLSSGGYKVDTSGLDDAEREPGSDDSTGF